MSSKFSLLVSMPDDGPVTHDLDGDSISLGRGPDNDIQVLISEVSVKHGELKADGDGFKIVDLGSTNGTLVNGAKV
ncbi:MAG: FHA domain-containing protein, partial [Verrucomicrobiota bacterium]